MRAKFWVGQGAAIILILGTSQQTAIAAFPCDTIDTDYPIPAGFAPPYNVHSSDRELLLQATCSSNKVLFSVGNGNPLTYIFNRAYQFEDGRWEPFSLHGQEGIGSADDVQWWVGRASAEFPFSNEELQEEQFFVAYTCFWDHDHWECGCKDRKCTQNFWQLQGAKLPESGLIDLHVLSGGLGIGRITSNPSGIDCPSNQSSPMCSDTFQGQVTLTADPSEGSRFAGWSGACTKRGLQPDCSLTGTNLTAPVGAGFEIRPEQNGNKPSVDYLLDNLIFFELTNKGLERIAGQVAARRYDWLRNTIMVNRSGNLRGMILSARAHRVYVIAGKTSKFIEGLGFAIEGSVALREAWLKIDQIWDEPGLPDVDKRIETVKELSLVPAEVLSDFVLGHAAALVAITRIVKWINPIYWLDDDFDDNVAHADYWIDELDVKIGGERVDEVAGIVVDVIEISSDRFVEFLEIYGALHRQEGEG